MRIVMVLASVAIGALVATAGLGVFGGIASASDLPAMAKKMKVFRSGAVRESAVPRRVRAARDRLAAGRGFQAAMTKETRLLGTNLGVNRAAMYAFPTGDGSVCVVVSEKTTVSTCAPGEGNGVEGVEGGVAWGIYSGLETPVTVYGLASDSVTAVQVQVDGRFYDVSLENNGIFWQADPSVTRESIKALRIHESDGSDVLVDLASRQ